MTDKKKLSKSVLEMKFMKRTKEKILKEEDDAEGRAMYSNEITDKMLNEKSQYIIENSYVPCENLKEGRFSFHGMNPEIERLLELEEEARRLASENALSKRMNKDVSDRQMANVYYRNKIDNSSYTSKYKNRIKLNLPEPKNKKRFIKPKEEIVEDYKTDIVAKNVN